MNHYWFDITYLMLRIIDDLMLHACCWWIIVWGFFFVILPWPCFAEGTSRAVCGNTLALCQGLGSLCSGPQKHAVKGVETQQLKTALSRRLSDKAPATAREKQIWRKRTDGKRKVGAFLLFCPQRSVLLMHFVLCGFYFLSTLQLWVTLDLVAVTRLDCQGTVGLCDV